MRRCVFTLMGVLEAAVALVLLGFAWYLPGPAEVHDKVARVEKVSKQASAQVKHLRTQVRTLRERQPIVKDLAYRLEQQTKDITGNIKNQQLDFRTLQTVSDSFGDVAKGLDGLSTTLDPKGVEQMGKGLGADGRLSSTRTSLPARRKPRSSLEKTTNALRRCRERLAKLAARGSRSI